jgi:YggT family protein
MIELLRFISFLLDLYSYILIASIILSWLVTFNVVNARNQIVATIGDVLFRLTEPVLAPVRRRLPAMGNLDLSPVVVFLAIMFIQTVVFPNIAKALLR